MALFLDLNVKLYFFFKLKSKVKIDQYQHELSIVNL